MFKSISPSLVLITAIVVSLFYGCGNSQKAVEPWTIPPQVERYYIAGDPLQLIEGAKLDLELPKLDQFMTQFDGYYNHHKYDFVKRLKIRERGNVEDGQEAPSGRSSGSSSRGDYSFHSVIKGKTLYYKTRTKLTTLVFDITENEDLILRSVQYKNSTFTAAELIHFSLDLKTNKVFSLLFLTSNGKSGKTLVQLTFSKYDGVSETRLIGNDAPYLGGKGVGYRWEAPDELKLNFCGKDMLPYADDLNKGIRRWEDAANGRIKISSKLLSSGYPPFSDLNFQCIYSVTNYLTASDPKFSNPGFALNSTHISTSQFVDSDIFLVFAEMEKHSNRDRRLLRQVFFNETDQEILSGYIT